MNPPKSKTTIRISTNLGPANQFTDMTTIEVKGRTPQEKGEHYLQLSLKALEELATLLKDGRLSEQQRTSYYNIYDSSKAQHASMIELRNQLLSHKKSLCDFVINFFVRKSDAKRFHKITYRNFANIRRTSDDLHTLLLPGKDDIFASATPSESAQGGFSVREENPRDVVEGDCLVKDLPPDAQIGGFNLDLPTEQEANEALGMLYRMTTCEENDDDDDDDRTIRPSHSRSRPPSPSPICTIIYNISQSVVSFDSESNGSTLNIGVDGEASSSSSCRPDPNQPPPCQE